MLRRILFPVLLVAAVLGLAGAAQALRVGFDARHGQPIPPNDDVNKLAQGDAFADLRQLMANLGHTVVPVSSFESVDLGAANVVALYLAHPFIQNFTDEFGMGDPATFGYSAAERTAIHDFVASGGGLVLFGEVGAGSEPVGSTPPPPPDPNSFDGVANYNLLAAPYGVSFSDDETEDDGHTILLFEPHPVTAGLSSDPLTGGYCLDGQRRLTIGSPAVDLTTASAPLVPEDDAIAAVTGTGSAGNVVILSDSSGFKDPEHSGFNIDGLDCRQNLVLATNVANFVVPEPHTLALFGCGLFVFGASRSRRRPGRRVLPALLAVAIGSGLATPDSAHAACTGTAAQCQSGAFASPFEDPKLLGLWTQDDCLLDYEGEWRCKITAGTLVALPDDRFLYWNALEGTENVEVTIATEFGFTSTNDQSRLLSIDVANGDAPSWSWPGPPDGGANPDGNPDGIGPCNDVENTGADGALFCSDQVMLHDGSILAAGGTDYYNDACAENEFLPPGAVESVVFPPGGVELEGLKNARVFDPATDDWRQTDSMEFGRWYPAAVTLPDSDVFIASGVTKLVKPVYPEAPFNSGRNVVQTETFDTSCELWSNNGGLAEKSLPLFPRLHLLPNGHVYYNAAGQAFNPFGQGYDQSLWNVVSTYDPVSKTWTDHAIAGFPVQLSDQGLTSIATDLNPTNPDGPSDLLLDLVGEVIEDPAAVAELLDDQIIILIGQILGLDLTDPAVVMSITGGGFRGSTFSVMLPLEPDTSGNYEVAHFLTAGGTQSSIVNPSPGGYLATALSRIDTMDLTGSVPVYSSSVTGSLGQARWYGSGTLLPNGQVLATSGGDRDEVQTPGQEVPIIVAELFDPATNSWSLAATQNKPRTYHNSAVLMRDGRVLVGGHAPITSSYTAFESPSDSRDPSFEIYSPPYVFRDDRPGIASTSTSQLDHGQSFQATVTGVTDLHNVVLMRRSAATHVTDADQRAVVLRVLAVDGSQLTLDVPGPNLLPPGKYVLYVNNTAGDGSVVPSEGVALTVGDPPAACAP